MSGKLMALKLIQSLAILGITAQLGLSPVLPIMVSAQKFPVETLPILAGGAEDHLRIAQLL